MRPYSTYSIDNLEALVDANQQEKETLQAVKGELSFRGNKKRQRRLLDSINALLVDDCTKIALPASWVDHLALEKVLSDIEPIKPGSQVHIFVPKNSNIMVSAAVQILSITNQLLATKCEITIEFEDGWSGAMGYLKRINFFKHLSKKTNVIPCPHNKTHQNKHEGRNASLVEIERISIREKDPSLPARLTNSVINKARGKRSGVAKLETAISTLFSELTSNVYLHSKTTLPAYAVCQSYSLNKKSIMHVSVCDTGIGILETIKPALPIHYSSSPELQKMSDEQLILKMFLNGISSKGPNNGGDGLIACAKQAMKFNATISIRTNNTLTQLTPAHKHYVIDTKPPGGMLFGMKGTYITFQIPLGSLT